MGSPNDPTSGGPITIPGGSTVNGALNVQSLYVTPFFVNTGLLYLASQGAATGMWGGANAPAAGLGNNGDYYFRNDTPATSLQRIYVKSAGSWVGIV
jgi:hypothetical protein